MTNARRSVQAVLAAFALMSCAHAPAAEPGSRFVVATPQQVIPIFTADDEFMAVLTPADISIRTRSAEGTRADLVRTYAGAFEPWTAEESTRLDAMLERRRAQLLSIARWLPDTVYLAKSNGAADTPWPHTRGPAINLGPDLSPQDHYLDSLFFHELFHVLSRHNAERHDEMYAMIGFVPCAIMLPPEVQARTLTNPDAPLLRWAAPIGAGGRYVFTAAFAEPPRFDPGQPAFPSYFKMHYLEARADSSGRCALDGAQPVEISQEEALAAFHAAAGENTDYVLHPEELLADNFASLMMGEAVQSPEIQQRLAAFLGVTYPQRALTAPRPQTTAPAPAD